MKPPKSKPRALNPMVWMGDSLEVLRGFPEAVREEMGFGLYLAQTADKYIRAKPLKGLGSGVLEVVRTIAVTHIVPFITLRLAGKAYVLHAFQKKSKRGIATPKTEIDLIRQRLRRAMELHATQED